MASATIEKQEGILAACRALALETNGIASRLTTVCGSRTLQVASFQNSTFEEGIDTLKKIEYALAEIKAHLDEIDDQVSAIIERL